MHVFGEALENIFALCFIIMVKQPGEAFSDEGEKNLHAHTSAFCVF